MTTLPAPDRPVAEADEIMKTNSTWTWRDWWGTIKVRWNIGRSRSRVLPGLYTLNEPTPDSDVLVSANYKLSFDVLRKQLRGQSVWILVLDTKGINVWCAAGKGTFGTKEVVRRVRAVQLDQRVKHRRLILPQLGAPGVAAHDVKKETGFQVFYGPVRAQDLPAYLKAARQATPRMRRIRFNLWERMVLIPVEVIWHFKYVLLAAAVFAAISGLFRYTYSINHALAGGFTALMFLLAGLLAGTVLTPILLPLLPGRAFALKGFWSGLAVYAALRWWIFPPANWFSLEVVAWLLAVLATASYSAMNYTGTSTYTSLSGVQKEMRQAVPWQFAGLVGSLVLWTMTRFQ